MVTLLGQTIKTKEEKWVEGEKFSDITSRHLEQVINTMIPLSTYSTLDPIESAPTNSIVTQPSGKDREEQEPTQTPSQKERQVIVNNYYISDREKGWKQLEEGEILPNTLDNNT